MKCANSVSPLILAKKLRDRAADESGKNPRAEYQERAETHVQEIGLCFCEPFGLTLRGDKKKSRVHEKERDDGKRDHHHDTERTGYKGRNGAEIAVEWVLQLSTS